MYCRLTAFASALRNRLAVVDRAGPPCPVETRMAVEA